MARRAMTIVAPLLLLAAVALPASAVNINAVNAYSVRHLVSDGAIQADFTDPSLVNGWGIAALPASPWWVSDNGTNKSTLYNGNTGAPLSLVVSVPGEPTGVVANTSSSFQMPAPLSGPARFIFDGLGGTISAWNPSAGTAAVEVVDSTDEGAVYTGLAIGRSGGHDYIYTADFHNGTVDVYDGSFEEVDLAGDFEDPRLPTGYSPFGIQAVGDWIVVTYALRDESSDDEVAGEGLGFVDVFGTDGTFVDRVASRGELNAPWGVAMAPASGFGKFSGDLLVGNFGDGRISAYRLGEDGWEGHGILKGPDHRPLEIDGLWGIGFGNGAGAGSRTVLYFASGPDDETHGLFGSVTAAP